MVKSPNLRRASGGLLNNALRPPKIKKQLATVQDLIDKNDITTVDMRTLEVLKVAYTGILDGDDLETVLQRLAN
jgi:hypothetical protein